MQLLEKIQFDNNEKLSAFWRTTAGADNFNYLESLVQKDNAILVTDEHFFKLHEQKFDGWKTIVIPAGEIYKQQATVDTIITKLIQFEADRTTTVIGIGGGVVTDIVGYAACVYMRGIKFGFVPTTILAMVDAAIGGKNGVDVGLYKNLVGQIKQPSFLVYDFALLKTLPHKEWINGFAEIIKHACIKDADIFATLEQHALKDFETNTALLADLITRNVAIKTAVVVDDEFEKGDRKLLNFGHTIGHAIENLHQLPHGHAVSIGMVAACNLSEQFNDFHFDEAKRIVLLLSKYHLPVDIETEHEEIFSLLKMDKKRAGAAIDFILLRTIGVAQIKSVPLDLLHKHLKEIV
jgi:3-dehydroquinate synthase